MPASKAPIRIVHVVFGKHVTNPDFHVHIRRVALHVLNRYSCAQMSCKSAILLGETPH